MIPWWLFAIWFGIIAYGFLVAVIVGARMLEERRKEGSAHWRQQ